MSVNPSAVRVWTRQLLGKEKPSSMKLSNKKHYSEAPETTDELKKIICELKSERDKLEQEVYRLKMQKDVLEKTGASI